MKKQVLKNVMKIKLIAQLQLQLQHQVCKLKIFFTFHISSSLVGNVLSPDSGCPSPSSDEFASPQDQVSDKLPPGQKIKKSLSLQFPR